MEGNTGYYKNLRQLIQTSLNEAVVQNDLMVKELEECEAAGTTLGDGYKSAEARRDRAWEVYKRVSEFYRDDFDSEKPRQKMHESLRDTSEAIGDMRGPDGARVSTEFIKLYEAIEESMFSRDYEQMEVLLSQFDLMLLDGSWMTATA